MPKVVSGSVREKGHAMNTTRAVRAYHVALLELERSGLATPRQREAAERIAALEAENRELRARLAPPRLRALRGERRAG